MAKWKWQDIADARAALDATIKGALCVQAWLGAGNVLFLGFGDEVLPPTPEGSYHPRPAYELKIDFTHWWVENESNRMIGPSYDERSKVESTAGLLVGHRAIQWDFIEPFPALVIVFDNGLKLKMVPYDDYIGSHKDAWMLSIAIHYYSIMWDGTMATGRRDKFFLEDDEYSESKLQK